MREAPFVDKKNRIFCALGPKQVDEKNILDHRLRPRRTGATSPQSDDGAGEDEDDANFELKIKSDDEDAPDER